jgi:hypothetical protein
MHIVPILRGYLPVDSKLTLFSLIFGLKLPFYFWFTIDCQTEMYQKERVIRLLFPLHTPLPLKPGTGKHDFMISNISFKPKFAWVAKKGPTPWRQPQRGVFKNILFLYFSILPVQLAS